jgi:hypothetical protein
MMLRDVGDARCGATCDPSAAGEDALGDLLLPSRRRDGDAVGAGTLSSMLTGTLTNTGGHPQLNVWATTRLPSRVARSLKARKEALPEGKETHSKTFVQHDRMAQPEASEKIRKLQLDPTSGPAMAALANVLALRLPDVLRLEVTRTPGFPADNGRRPEDDVVSFELGPLTVGVVTNEGIPGSNGRSAGTTSRSCPASPSSRRRTSRRSRCPRGIEARPSRP